MDDKVDNVTADKLKKMKTLTMEVPVTDNQFKMYNKVVEFFGKAAKDAADVPTMVRALNGAIFIVGFDTTMSGFVTSMMTGKVPELE